MAPGSTTASRCAGSTRKMRFIRLSAITMPPAIGTDPPDKLVPLPRATKGTRFSWHQRTAATTSARVSGITTASGRA